MRKGILVFLVALTATGCGESNFDIIIENGSVIDGTGAPAVITDIGIRGAHIVSIGNLTASTAATRIDASGLTVVPGFIDIHSHATSSSIEGSAIVKRPSAENYVRQGVTSVFGGQDGSSALDVGAFLEYLDENPPAINVGLFIGHGSVRADAVGQDDRNASEEEMSEMTDLVRQAMDDGAFGLSSGLEYTPGAFADVDELIRLARPVAEFDGMYISHIRDEGARLLESVTEVIDVGRGARVRVQVTHHKVIGKGRWGMAVQSLALIDQAIKDGIDASSDQYPYTASSTGLTILFPTWSKDGGFDALLRRLADPVARERIRSDVIDHIRVERGADPSTIVAAKCDFDSSFDGKSLADILRDRGLEVEVAGAADVAIELVAAGSCSRVFHSMSEADVTTIMKHPMTSVSSDGGIPIMDVGVPHPRNYGAFARVLGYFVREQKVFTLEEAVRKMTSLPAERLNLLDRGVIRVGAVADIAVFDARGIADTARFGDPHHFAVGVRDVLVSGQFVLRSTEMTLFRPGKALRNRY